MTVDSAPQKEIGYTTVGAGNATYNWWMYDGETTPELQWPQSIEVYDAMRKQDAQVQSVLRAVTLPVRRTPWRIDPAGAAPDVVQFVAQDLGLPIVGQPALEAPPRTRDRFSWPEHLRMALLMLPFGHMYFEQVYRVDEDGSRAHLRKLGERMPRTIDMIAVDRDGGLISITQCTTLDGAGPQKPIPVNRLVAYIHEREGGNWLGQSILRAAYKNWLLKDRLLRVQAQSIDRNGMGIPVYTAAENETNLAAGKSLATTVRSGESAGAAIPAGATLQLLGVEGQLPNADVAIRYHDEQIARAVLAHFLNLGAQTGSWALGTTFADFFTLSLQTLAQQVADTATQHIIEDLVDVNWGPEEPAPRLVFDEIGSRQEATAQALKLLVDSGVIRPDQILEQFSRQQYGLPPAPPGGDERPPAQGADGPSVVSPDVDPAALFDAIDEFGAESVAASAGGDIEDDDEDPVLDDMTLALVVAMAEFAGEGEPVAAKAAFNPTLHPRGTKGRFRTTVDRLIDALNKFSQSGGTGDPFAAFTRDQLYRAAKTRKLTIPRGASRSYISKALVADLTGAPPTPGAPAPPPAPAAGAQPWTATPFPGPPFPGQKTSLEIRVGGVHIGAVHEDAVTGEWTANATQHYRAQHVAPPPNATKAQAIQSLVDAEKASPPPPAPVKVSTAVAGIAGVTSKPVPVPALAPGSPSWMTPAKQAHEIYVHGIKVGQIEQHSYGWNAVSVLGNPQGMGRTKTAAVKALVAHYQRVRLPGVTLHAIPWPGGRRAFRVEFNGADMGTMVDSPNGDWIPTVKAGAPYALQNPGVFSTREDAAQELVDSWDAFHNPPTSAIPGVTLSKAPVTMSSAPGAVSLAVSLNGVDVGTVNTGSGPGWTAFVPNSAAYTFASGTPGNTFATRNDAEQALVDAYNLHQLTQALSTGTVTPNAPSSSLRFTTRPGTAMGTGTAEIVSYGGVDVGTVEHDPVGNQYFAYKVNSPLWPAAPLGVYTNKAQANRALLKAYQTKNGQIMPGATTGAPSATGTSSGVAANLPNGVSISPFVSNNGAASSAHAFHGGLYIGGVHEWAHDDWNAFRSNQTTGRLTRTSFPSREDALQALLDDYTANPWPANPTGPNAPFGHRPNIGQRIQETIDRHAAEGGGPNDPNDPLAGFTRTQLLAAAKANGVPVPRGTTDRQLSTALITKLAPPPPAPPTPITYTPPIDPAVKAAQDVLYGVDPKAKTASHQLSVYGNLRKNQFDSLDPREQTTLLADLSYIEATSKGPNATKATKLIHNFTPAGTKPGTIPTQPILVPAGAAAHQTRVADPNGTAGLLNMLPSAKRGKSGDGWTRTTSGGSGPWGQYGAAGLMLRHVDPATGEERFLMIERGPGISNPGLWQFPGGAKEEKEDFYQGATREVVEELGFKTTDLDTARVHGTHTFEVANVTVPALQGGQVPWGYVSIAATVPTQLVPDLSAPHAQFETSDAKWMTRAEIANLEKRGKLMKQLAGGQLDQNILSLFPQSRTSTATVTPPGTRPPRLTGTPSVPTRTTPYKPSRATNLIADKAAIDKLRQDVKAARKAYAGKTADERLAAIGAMQGFDDTPTVVTKAEIDRLVATGDYIEAWRGVRGAGSSSFRSGRGGATSRGKTAAQIQEDFRSGVAYYGHGMYGNGFYFATDKSVAQGYSDGSRGSLLRVLIPKKVAKIETHTRVESDAHAASSSRSASGTGEEGTLWDEGRYAAAKGLDAIEIPYTWGNAHVAPNKNLPAYTVLNRSILVVQEA